MKIHEDDLATIYPNWTETAKAESFDAAMNHEGVVSLRVTYVHQIKLSVTESVELAERTIRRSQEGHPAAILARRGQEPLRRCTCEVSGTGKNLTYRAAEDALENPCPYHGDADWYPKRLPASCEEDQDPPGTIAFCDWVRRERKKKGWTRRELAEKVLLRMPETVKNWEKGSTLPQHQTRLRLEKVFGETIKEGRVLLKRYRGSSLRVLLNECE